MHSGNALSGQASPEMERPLAENPPARGHYFWPDMPLMPFWPDIPDIPDMPDMPLMPF